MLYLLYLWQPLGIQNWWILRGFLTWRMWWRIKISMEVLEGIACFYLHMLCYCYWKAFVAWDKQLMYLIASFYKSFQIRNLWGANVCILLGKPMDWSYGFHAMPELWKEEVLFGGNPANGRKNWQRWHWRNEKVYKLLD